eukprot:TRINITY_DN24037_c0_g1_i1.p1 TRINITY_DN24037_c0_g1~~TRINITY_DN24037_c0_g1_i1.p1  ORF type:complete len:775 (-),score=278.46 TRINITY_DN24037_c0_g1_i1:166-2490(-)
MLPWTQKSSKLSSVVAKAQATAKNNILSAVSEAVSEVQYQYRNSDTAIPSNDITARLCTSLEAVFVHGLKETFLGRLSSRLSGHEAMVASPKMPEPSFWTFALVFSHKQVISQVDSLSQVSSEVGRARAWLRLALNDGLLVSYLTAMVCDNVSLAVHYEKFAFLRDPDKRDLCLSYLTGISVYTFNLSINVSTLNRWQPRPLVLAGCWRQTTTEVDIGADVAADLVEEVLPAPEFVRTLAEPIRDGGPGSYMRRGLINEEEALRLILQSTPVSFSPDIKMMEEMKVEDSETDKKDVEYSVEEIKTGEQDDLPDDSDRISSCQFDQSRSPTPTPHPSEPTPLLLPPSTSPLPASYSPSPEPMLSRSQTVSPTLEWDHPDTQPDLPLSPASLADELILAEQTSSPVYNLPDIRTPSPHPPTPPTPSPLPSPAHSLSSQTSCQCSTAGPQPDCPACSLSPTTTRPQLVLAAPHAGQTQGTDLITAQTTRIKRLQGLGFSHPPSIRVPSLSLAQNISLTSALDQVTQEGGLDTQGWQCAECSKSIGAIFGPGLVCAFTRKYYCSECHTNTQTAVIPARLMYNWDGTQYKVARSSMVFLQAVATKPIIDIRSFSPNLPKFAQCLDTSYRLRKQLTYLSAYLTACSRAGQEGAKVSLAEAVWPREYLYTGTDMYSLRDMEQLYTGELITTLTTAVGLCMKHVSSCLVCSGRGFICELCKDRRPVYPFNLDTSSQCSECLTVFHSSCAAGLSTCPKCERLEARSLNWHVTNSKLARETAGS